MSQINEFLHMGGYAFYVWTSYGLGLIILLLNTVIPMRQEKRIIRNLLKRQERK